jgi:hypothetical protein
MAVIPYPKFDEVMRALLGDIAPVVTFVDDNTPRPYIRVTRVGGAEDGVADNPLIYTEYVAETRAASKALETAGQDRVLFAGNTAPGGFLIDTAEERSGGVFLPPHDRDVRAVSATYRLSYRRPRA